MFGGGHKQFWGKGGELSLKLVGAKIFSQFPLFPFLFSERKSLWKGSQIVLLAVSVFSICLSAAAFGLSLYHSVLNMNKEGKLY